MTCAVAGIALVVAAAAEAATMAPHRATYTLAQAPDSGPRETRVLDGLIVFEISDDCDGHTLTDRTVILLSGGDGGNITLDSQYSAWESKDGEKLRFLTSLRLDGRTIEELRGSATLEGPAGPGVATFTSPEYKEVKLPVGTRFPIQAGVHSLAEIAGGARQLSYYLFDGSNSDGAYLATDFVVAKPISPAAAPEGDLDLLASPSWRIRTAVFDIEDDTAPPSSELDGQTHANGVISAFTLELDAFAAQATLTRVEALPESGC